MKTSTMGLTGAERLLPIRLQAVEYDRRTGQRDEIHAPITHGTQIGPRLPNSYTVLERLTGWAPATHLIVDDQSLACYHATLRDDLSPDVLCSNGCLHRAIKNGLCEDCNSCPDCD